MGSNERRERERLETRAKILDAARELFAAHGFEAVTMRKIAEKIEYTPTAIYFHFKDKDALIHELCAVDFLAFAEKFAEIANQPDPVERLRAAGHVYAAFAHAHPNSYRLMFMTPQKPASATKGDEPWKGDPARDAYAFLKWTVEECVAKRRFRRETTDADLLSQTIWAAMHGVVALEIARGEDAWVDWRSFDDRLAAMIDVLVRGLEQPAKASKPSKPAKPSKRSR